MALEMSLLTAQTFNFPPPPKSPTVPDLPPPAPPVPTAVAKAV